MSYYESEILKELEEGEIYTSRQIDIFFFENRDVVILCDTNHISDSTDIKYTVVKRSERYIHKQSEVTYGSRVLPSRQSRVYELERVY
ncbi:hypothetical protein ACDI16_02435 [Oceanobacillus caeni]